MEKEGGEEVSKDSGRIVFDTTEGPIFADWDEAPAEALIENTKRGNIDAWKAMLERIGMTEEDFINQVAEDVTKEAREIIQEDKNDGTVE